MPLPDDPLIVTMHDVRAAHGCRKGAKAFCDRHGIDWMTFLRDGVGAQILIDTGDAMALNLVEVARGRKQ